MAARRMQDRRLTVALPTAQPNGTIQCVAERVSLLNNPYAVGVITRRDVAVSLDGTAIRFDSSVPFDDLARTDIVETVRCGNVLLLLTGIGDVYLLDSPELVTAFPAESVADTIGITRSPGVKKAAVGVLWPSARA